MKLQELSDGYREAAQRVRTRLAELNRLRTQTTDPRERWILTYEIQRLRPVLTELNDLAELTEHYYDRGYYRDKRYTL